MQARIPLKLFALAWLGLASAASAAPPGLTRIFEDPPPAARPWVYWFWLNGNVTKEGITADLEAMARVGIGGVLLMEVDQGAPAGPVSFAGPLWREMFRHACLEADRLGLQVNMNDDAGWNGSGGPWIQPEQAMQRLVWSETVVEGPGLRRVVLPQPETVRGFYRDVAVVAVPKPGPFRISDLPGKSAVVRQEFAAPREYPAAPKDSIVRSQDVRLLGAAPGPDGALSWTAPPGRWVVLRFGRTLTGAENAPAPESGRGLECDKLSVEGARAAFEGFIGKLAGDVAPLVGRTFVTTHIDSWENHSQNWTASFPQQFARRRGYPIWRRLPSMAGYVVDSLETSERFLADVRQTVADLVRDCYAGEMRRLAASRGLRLSIEAYGDCVFDDVAYAGQADEPMGEFWSWPNNFTADTVSRMASACNVYGKTVLGAEAFTATDGERWRLHPGNIKALGDWALCRGVNRIVFHRYAMQPWIGVAPGMSMGPWGLHYERTQTWWEQSAPWHNYLARCQALLRQGLPVVDLLWVQPEGAPRAAVPPEGAYRSDVAPAEAVIRRLEARGGSLALPHGMRYAALVLPDTPKMSPELLRKVLALARSGAKVFAATKPVRAPGLSGYPRSDAAVRRLADQLWSEGLVLPLSRLERKLGLPPDFQSDAGLDFIHRRVGGTEVYFVANPWPGFVSARATFRVTGKQPELWDPWSGERRLADSVSVGRGTTTFPLRLHGGQSVFVVFDRPMRKLPPNLDEGPMARMEPVQVLRAVWGPADDPGRTLDVTAWVRERVRKGRASFVVADLVGRYGDPALNVLKTLRVTYRSGGEERTVSATDPERVFLPPDGDPEPAATLAASHGAWFLEARLPGSYRVDGRTVEVAPWPSEFGLPGPWSLRVPVSEHGSSTLSLTRLRSWSEMEDPAVRCFSGTAVYETAFDLPDGFLSDPRRVELDLGRVEVVAEVELNGRALGTLWHPPFRVDATGALRARNNRLVVRVTNLWINRLIGDEELPPEPGRRPDGTLESWPEWLRTTGKSPTGRVTFGSWLLWRRGEPLVPSGLLGPVRLIGRAVVPLPEQP
ncbi:MAG: glycosyl hydrolase [Fimbriimonadaceae bacterium]